MKKDKEGQKEIDINNDDNYISYEQCIELGKKQWEVAMQGDTRMLIWLGKNYLNQSDSPMVVSEKPISEVRFNECDDVTCACCDCQQSIFNEDRVEKSFDEALGIKS